MGITTLKKQIANYKFLYKENEVEITEPCGKKIIMSYEKADIFYMTLKCVHKADILVEKLIKEMGYTKDTIGLQDESVKVEFYRRLVRKLKEQDFDLKSKIVRTNKWNLDIVGNHMKIASCYIHYLWKDNT